VSSFAPSPFFFAFLDLSLRLALIDDGDDHPLSFLRDELFWQKKRKDKKNHPE